MRKDRGRVWCKHASNDPRSLNALGSTDSEHERLIRQAARLAPYTERFFREAGIGPGQRVLDLGSGVGDVAMLAARLVGPSGEVVAVERDAVGHPRQGSCGRSWRTQHDFHPIRCVTNREHQVVRRSGRAFYSDVSS